MEQPPAGLAIQGFLTPALIEEHSDIQKHISGGQFHDTDINAVGKIAENKPEAFRIINVRTHESDSSEDNWIWAEESKKVDIPTNVTSSYKLEMIKIQLILAHGNQVLKCLFNYRCIVSLFG